MIDFERMADEAAKSAAKSFGWNYSKEKSYSKSDGNGFDTHGVDLDELGEAIVSGADLHTAALKVIGLLASKNYDAALTRSFLHGWFNAAHAERYQGRWPEIERAILDIYKKEEAKRQANEEPRPPGPFIKSSKEFVASFTPPDFLIDRLLIQSFLYALTGQTGSGKTAITLRLAACVALGTHFNGLDVTQRRVLYLAAENPIDVQMRWIALAQQMDFDPATIPVFFVEGIFKISDLAMLKIEAEKVGGDFGLVVIDTGPAFYEGEDQNSRTEMFKHARTFRNLINGIPGKPTILANMHPTKRVGEDGLVPAGGGSFLNEIDGNLTAAKNDAAVELHWCGKMRGIEFNPLNFLIKSVTHERLIDKKGKLIPTVIAEPLSERDKEDMERAAMEDWKMILAIMRDDPEASIAEIAEKMMWMLGNKPNKPKAQRATNAMIKGKLVKRDAFKKWELTKDGEAVLAE